MQITLLSNDAPAIKSRAARSRSAVSSTTDGGLPGPAVIAFFPAFRASRTTAGPPVTTFKRMPLYLSSAWAISSVGCSTECSSGSCEPARRAARLMRSTARFETLRALGCGQKTAVLPPAIIESPLLITVSLGLVTGVITAITP